MGKKSRRNNRNNGGLLRKGLAAVPTAAAPANIFMTVCRLMEAHNFEKILKIESKYRHLDTFSNDPVEDSYVFTSFGHVNHVHSQGEACIQRVIDYYERAKERMEDASYYEQYHSRISMMKATIGYNLPQLYSEGRDMEKAISSHRWLLENCNSNCHEYPANYVIHLSGNFIRFEKFEYAIEVLEGSMDMIERFEEEFQAASLIYLVDAYIGCGEFLKAKAADEKRRSSPTHVYNWEAGLQLGRIEEGMCNYEAAIAHFRKVAAVHQTLEYDGGIRVTCSLDLARTLLRHNTDNEAVAFAVFQEELDRCEDPLDRDNILIEMGAGYRKLNKWDQSIKALHQLCLSSTRPDGTMLSQANKSMAQTYLEQYCADTTLTIDQRTETLCHAKICSLQVDGVSTETHLTQAQLSYFDGDKNEAYRHLELYLDARLSECKLSCYSCEQRIRHGSVPFSCASCLVASYCGRKHQKLTWKNERICHKVLCPLFGYWRMTKKGKKRRESNEKGSEDRREYVRVFETFFQSISLM